MEIRQDASQRRQITGASTRHHLLGPASSSLTDSEVQRQYTATERLLVAVHRFHTESHQSADNLDCVVHLLDTVQEITKSEFVFIAVWADDAQELRLVACSSEPGGESTQLQAVIAACNKIGRSGELLLQNDRLERENANGEFESFLSPPLYNSDREVGVVGLGNRPTGYDQRIVAFLEPFTTTCGVLLQSMENERERQASERALREHEQLLKGTLESLESCIAILDREGVIVSCNRAWHTLVANVEWEGTKSPAHFSGLYRVAFDREEIEFERFVRDVSEVLQGRLPEFTSEHQLFVNSEPRWYATQIVPFADGEGRVVVAHQDITRRKRAEDALKLTVAGTARETGWGFYRSLVKHLSRALGHSIAILAEICDGRMTARTLAVWASDSLVRRLPTPTPASFPTMSNRDTPTTNS